MDPGDDIVETISLCARTRDDRSPAMLLESTFDISAQDCVCNRGLVNPLYTATIPTMVTAFHGPNLLQDDDLPVDHTLCFGERGRNAAISLMSTNCKFSLPGTDYHKFLEGHCRRYAPAPFMYKHQGKNRGPTNEERLRAKLVASLARGADTISISLCHVEEMEQKAKQKPQTLLTARRRECAKANRRAAKMHAAVAARSCRDDLAALQEAIVSNLQTQVRSKK